ncbi:hypothetical protein Tco_0841250 [Tanacetum coccineum]|uniref:DUF4219 domain-containing protein n=1 Tax=Tanacetum coccineum TaxID=301880 RepID=A0ABQ5AX65_9ASTR
MKIPIIKKGEYDIWSMRMRQYICHTDHNLWDIIVDGDLQEEAAPAGEQSGPPAPKTAKQLTAKRNQERVKSILLLAIPLLPSGYFRVITVGGIVQQARPVLSTPDDLEELDIRWKVAMMTVRLQCLRKGHFAMEGKSGKEPGKSIYGVKARGMQQQNEPSHKHLWHKIVLIGYAGAMILIEHRYGTQLDEMSNKSETDSEISMSVFEVRSSDEEITPANDRFSKADGYHAVPPSITGNLLTPRADISFACLDEYAIRKKIIESKTDTTKSKTSETVGKTNEVNIEKPKSVHELVVSKPKINRDKVIIEDWNSDDEDDVSAVKTVSPVKTNETQTVRNRVDKVGQISQKEGIGFKK